MDSLTTQKPKSRKIKRIAKKSRAQILLDLFFRAVEIIVVLVTLAKLCNELIIAFQDSGVSTVILANRHLAFVIGNAIVIALIATSSVFSNQEVGPKCKSNALIAKSGVLAIQEADPTCKSNDLYDEYVRESSKRKNVKESETKTTPSITITETRPKENEEEEKEKQNISDKTEKHGVTENKNTKQIVEITVKKNEKKQSSSYRRSKSDNIESLKKSTSCGKLRRSETDASFDSDDELRYKIESFIARQRRNQTDD